MLLCFRIKINLLTFDLKYHYLDLELELKSLVVTIWFKLQIVIWVTGY